ncbi:MAG: amidohydrolase family protein [Gemmatimonadales bacterium]|nr:amidohydrolase family protein [Gemmatimonadales bacterium]
MSSLLEYGRTGQPLPIPDIIDVHGHLGVCGFAIPDTTPASMVEVMDRMGIRSIICSSMHCWEVDTSLGNRELMAAMRAFPGRILGYLSVWPSEEAAVRAEVDFCLESGFVGVKVHNSQGFPYTHLGYLSAYERAEERRLPILFHTGGEERVFAEIAELARRYPNASMILAHAGTANVEGYIRMATEHANVFLDTAYSTSPRGLVEQLVAGAGADKVLWGSDGYFFNQAQQIGKVLGAKIPDEAKVKILSTNALAILARPLE